jgi:hypothetical protein
MSGEEKIMMSKKTARIIALILCIAMVVSSIVFAVMLYL